MDTLANRPDHKLIREFVKHFATLRADPVYEDTDECERKEIDGIWKCVAKSGKTCDKGTCKFVTVTVKVDGVEKTVTYCMCSGL